jgi:hypothetical protein
MSNTNTTMIKQFIRDRKNNPRGVAVAVKHENEVFYGYSLCNPIDRFNKSRGIEIAVSRALSQSFHLPISPNTQKQIEHHFMALERRAVRYFKDVPEENIRIDFNASIVVEDVEDFVS